MKRLLSILPLIFSVLALGIALRGHVGQKPAAPAGPMGLNGPNSWTVAAWFVDPANSSGCASDGNTGTSATCTGGTNIGPLLTFGQIYSRWGTTTPALTINVTVHLMGNDGSSDPWLAVPTYNGGSLTVVGTPVSVTTVTIGTFTPQVTATTPALNKITASGQSGAYWTTYVGDLVNDTTANAWFRVTSDLGGATAGISAPVGIDAFVPPWKTIANGDSLTIDTLPSVYVAVADSSNLVFPIGFSLLHILGVGVDGLVTQGAATFERCTISAIMFETSVRPTQFANCDIDTSSVIEGVSYVHAGQSRGQLNLQGYSSSAGGEGIFSSLDGDVILTGTIYVASDLFVGAAGFFDSIYADKSSQPNRVTLSSQFYGVARQWGTAPFNVAEGTQIGLGQSAVSSLLLTGGYTMDGLTTACTYDVSGNPAIMHCGISINPTNLDKSVLLGGFGGVMFDQYGSRVFLRQ